MQKIVLCEMHCDPFARDLVLENLSSLLAEGFQEFGFEHDEDKPIDFEVNCLREHFRRIPILPTFSYDDAYASMMNPSNRVLLKVFELVQRLEKEGRVKYRGLDVALGNRFGQTITEQGKKIGEITNEVREKKIVENLLKARPGIFIIGADHMANAQRLLIEQLGRRETEEQFFFIVPFSALDKEAIDVRRRMIMLADRDPEAFYQRYCPLRQVLFFNQNPDNTANDRFREFVFIRLGKQYLPPNRIESPGFLKSFFNFFRDTCCPLPQVREEYNSLFKKNR